MLEKPDLPDAKIVACLQGQYGLPVAHVAFLPLGADQQTAVYRAVAGDGTSYFCKLRRGGFDEIAVALPRCLHDQGIVHVIAPLPTRTGQLWTSLDGFKVVLYSFVEGHSGFEVGLSDRHWVEFGAALKRIHTRVLPPALVRRIPRETYAPQWREAVEAVLAHVEHGAFEDPVAAKLAVFLRARRCEIRDLVARAARLARVLQARSIECILCHSDTHAGNLLIDVHGALYIVDWDDPILAPKERDLMFVGGGLGGDGHTPQEEETLFYRGYGPTQVDPTALAYYRCERIVQDIAVFCERILSAREGERDRAQCLQYLRSSFLPNGVLELAYRSDQTWRASP